MAIPTPVNGQITDAVTQANTKDGESERLLGQQVESIGRGIDGADHVGAASLPSTDAEQASSAVATAETELQGISDGWSKNTK